MGMGICLHMMVKNEAPRLPQLFASLGSSVDACVVSDTGSTDDTIACIRSWAARQGIPCQVDSHHWKDFAYNRNLSLQAAARARREGFHHCSWVMVIDADEVLRADDPAWKAGLTRGQSYSLHVRTGNTSVCRPFLLDITSTEWHWQGRVHNWVESLPPGTSFSFLETVTLQTGVFVGAKSHIFLSPLQKAEEDRRLLLEELSGATLTRGNAHRWFQLAYACQLAERHGEAVERMSSLMASSEVHPEIRYAAAILASKSVRAANRPIAEARSMLHAALSWEPLRWEASFYLSGLLRASGDAPAALSALPASGVPAPRLSGTFWMEHDVYDWRVPYERAFLLYQTGRWQEAADQAAALMGRPGMPDAAAGFLVALQQRIRQEIRSST